MACRIERVDDGQNFVVFRVNGRVLVSSAEPGASDLGSKLCQITAYTPHEALRHWPREEDRAQRMLESLDNPIWFALTTEHRFLTRSHGLARRYPPDVSPLAALLHPRRMRSPIYNVWSVPASTLRYLPPVPSTCLPTGKSTALGGSTR